MKDNRTLYELLGVRPQATATEVRTAYKLALDTLEANRATMPAQEFDDQVQLLRVAYTTLNDPISRAGYDADLETAARAAAAARPAGALATTPTSAASGVRADALGLRADALSLRADALMARADIPASGSSLGGDGLFSDWTPGMRRMVSFSLVGVLLLSMSFGISRCTANSARVQMEAREAAERKASEQAVLQEYYQMYGVRPANRAEMELMESERRRKENAERQAATEKSRAEEDQRRWEEESHRRGEETSRNVQRAIEAEREQQQQLKFQAEQLQLEISMTTNDRDRRRLQLQLKQVKERMSGE